MKLSQTDKNLTMFMRNFYNKNPDFKNNPDLLLARISAAVIPALSTLLGMAALKGETFVRGIFKSKNDIKILQTAGLNNNKNIIQNLRLIKNKTNSSNNRAITEYKKNKNNNGTYNKKKLRVYAGIMKTILLLIISIRLTFGLLIPELKKISKMTTVNPQTLSNDLNTIARILFILLNAIVPAIYAIVQKSAVQSLGGANLVEFGAGMISVAATHYTFDKAFVNFLKTYLGNFDKQIEIVLDMLGEKNSTTSIVLNAALMFIPQVSDTRNIAVDSATRMLRLTRQSIINLSTFLITTLSAGVIASAASVTYENNKKLFSCSRHCRRPTTRWVGRILQQ